MKNQKWLVYGSFVVMIMFGVVMWFFKPVEHSSLTVEQPKQEVFGWSTSYVTYIRNEANPQYDPEQKIVTVIQVDRDLHQVQYDQRTRISNLPEVVAGLPNVAPLATFDGSPLVCTLDPELTYPIVGVFVFRCEYPTQ